MLTVAFVTGSFLFCFVIITFIQHHFRASSFGFDQNCCCYTSSVPDAEVWVEFCFSGLPKMTTATKIKQGFVISLVRKTKSWLKSSSSHQGNSMNRFISIHPTLISCNGDDFMDTSQPSEKMLWCASYRRNVRDLLSEADRYLAQSPLKI